MRLLIYLIIVLNFLTLLVQKEKIASLKHKLKVALKKRNNHLIKIPVVYA